MLVPPQRLKILLVANDDDQTRLIRSVLAAPTTPSFEVDYASNGWDAQRQALDGGYAALLLEFGLSDIDGETLWQRLKASGLDGPALLLTSPGGDQALGSGADHLPKADGLKGDTLVRTIMGMVQRHALTRELVAARDEATRSTALLNQLVHDLATPLGVVMGMTQAVLADDGAMNADSRSCLEDVCREALRACEILKQSNQVEPSTSPGPASVTDVPSLDRANVPGPSPVADVLSLGRANVPGPSPVADVPSLDRANVPGPSPVADVLSLGRSKVPGPGSQVVLIADDDPATRRLVRVLLSSDHCSVLEAVDGQDAWRLIREHHPAVAILDWQMPVYSGLELTDVIKGDPQVRDMTVIMLTGRSAQTDRDKGARAHADLYLTKPFLPHELLGAVQHALGIN